MHIYSDTYLVIQFHLATSELYKFGKNVLFMLQEILSIKTAYMVYF